MRSSRASRTTLSQAFMRSTARQRNFGDIAHAIFFPFATPFEPFTISERYLVGVRSVFIGELMGAADAQRPRNRRLGHHSLIRPSNGLAFMFGL